MSRQSTAAALAAVMAQPDKRTKAARFREVADLVEQASAAGVSRATIVQVLAAEGLPLTEATLNSYITRARKARAIQTQAAPAALATATSQAHQSPATQLQPPTPTDAPSASQGLRSILRADADVLGAQRRMAAKLRNKAQGA